MQIIQGGGVTLHCSYRVANLSSLALVCIEFMVLEPFYYYLGPLAYSLLLPLADSPSLRPTIPSMAVGPKRNKHFTGSVTSR